MKIVALAPPGRLPTAVYDAGAWWGQLCTRHHVTPLGANIEWWRSLCSAQAPALLTGTGLLASIRAAGLSSLATQAGASLAAMQTTAPYRTAAQYLDTVRPLAEYLHLLNRWQSSVLFTVENGPRVRELVYTDSEALVRYARAETPLARLVQRSLARAPLAIDLLVVAVTRVEELLTAMIVVHALRAHHAGLHACLADHGHEDFSLALHLPRLREAGTLDAVFDSIVERKDERDECVVDVAASIEAGRPLRGYLRRDRNLRSPARVRPIAGSIAHPPFETFNSEPVLWTRLSPRRCYWDRCAFCALNAKYEDRRAPSIAEVEPAVDRLAQWAKAGYRTVNLGDEAISPAMLEQLSSLLLQRGLEIRFACCCKLERAFTSTVFELASRAGCYEIFWGLESSSTRLLQRMDKYVPGLDAEEIKRVLDAAAEAGIGTHVSLMSGFPGETVQEAAASVEFTIRCLARYRHATFNLNEFVLRPGSPISLAPHQFGVITLPVSGDMADRCPYTLTPELSRSARELHRSIPDLRARLYAELGWGRFGRGRGTQLALELYFVSGHGSVIKQLPDHEFARPLALRA